MLESWEYDLLQAEKERDEYFSKLPKCDCCGEHIQDDFLYDINGFLLCEDCVSISQEDASKYDDPKCDCCGMSIKDDSLYEIDGFLYCEFCISISREDANKYADD